MGKKGVILDNGKKAQSSMALYWKKSREISKHPKQKNLNEEKQSEITDKSVMSNFQKWKLHKQKLITKAYAKPSSQQNQKPTKNSKIEQQQNEMLESMMESKKPKIISIPGFKSKDALAIKLQAQTLNSADQSTNILKFPAHVAEISHQQIVQLLRQRKRKQEFAKEHQNQQRHHQHKKEFQEKEDVLLGDDLMEELQKKQKQREHQAQIKKNEQQCEAQAKKEQVFFKSQLLNKMQKEGVQKMLEEMKKSKQEKLKSQSQQAVKEKQQLDKATLQNNLIKQINKNEIQENNQSRRIQLNPKFLPRVLKK